MFEQLRQGEKRFILASTSKLGTGANIQNKVCAIHHLDIPWKPSDLEQQNGRGIRQGNSFSEVGIYHYVTEETFDAYMLGIITNKAKFIGQVMTSKEPARTCEDVDEMVLTYSEMQAIASENPLIKEKIELDNDIARLKLLESEHKKSVYEMQELALKKLPAKIEQYSELVRKGELDLTLAKAQNEHTKDFTIKIGDRTYTERAEAGKALEAIINQCIISGEIVKAGEYMGFALTVEHNRILSFGEAAPCNIVVEGELKYRSGIEINNDVGNIRRLENIVAGQIEQKLKQLSADLESTKTNLDEAKLNMDNPCLTALKKLRSRYLAEKKKGVKGSPLCAPNFY